MNSLIAGIDESGRGCCVASLVLTCAIVSTEQEKFLKYIGVKDSKAFKNSNNPREKRAKIAKKLKEILVYKTEFASPKTIDNYVESDIKSLNTLEYEIALRLIDWAVTETGLTINKIILDSNNMFNNLAIYVRKKYLIDCEAIDKADDKFISVSAASIIAKSTRDQLAKKIMGNYFDKGAGYPNKYTANWIKSWYDPKLLDYPIIDGHPIEHIRKSWSWFKKLEVELKKEHNG